MINVYESIDQVYVRNFIKSNFLHPERPRKATVPDAASDLVIYCSNSSADRDTWSTDQHWKDNNGVISYVTKHWTLFQPLSLDVSSHHPTTRPSSSSIPTGSQPTRAEEPEHHQIPVHAETVPVTVSDEPKRHQEQGTTVHAEQPQVKKTRRKGPTTPPTKRLEDLNRVYAVYSLVEFPGNVVKKTTC